MTATTTATDYYGSAENNNNPLLPDSPRTQWGKGHAPTNRCAGQRAKWGRGRATPERIKRESVNWSGLVWSLGCWSWSSSPSSSSRSRARETPVSDKDRKGWAACLSRRTGELEGHHPPRKNRKGHSPVSGFGSPLAGARVDAKTTRGGQVPDRPWSSACPIPPS